MRSNRAWIGHGRLEEIQAAEGDQIPELGSDAHAAVPSSDAAQEEPPHALGGQTLDRLETIDRRPPRA
jgi:hypothetical protein